MAEDTEKVMDMSVSDLDNDTTEANDTLPSSSKTTGLLRNYMPVTPSKKRKILPQVYEQSNFSMLPGAFANEILMNIFKFLPRKELDNCALVNRRWHDIVEVHKEKFARRCIDKLSIYSEDNPKLITFWGSSYASRKQIHFVLELDNPNQFLELARILDYSIIKCCVISYIALTGRNMMRLSEILQKADTKIIELQMRRVNLLYIDAPSFRNFCVKTNAQRFGFTEMAAENHFGNDFFNEQIFKEAKYLCITGGAADTPLLPIHVDDDTLLDFIFGKNVESTERKIASLDFPSISSDFVEKAIKRFENETDISHMVTEATLRACPYQGIPRYPAYFNFFEGYKNFISYNPIVKKEFQAQVISDKNGSFSVFLSIGDQY